MTYDPYTSVGAANITGQVTDSMVSFFTPSAMSALLGLFVITVIVVALAWVFGGRQ